jgi:hypothetical protein
LGQPLLAARLQLCSNQISHRIVVAGGDWGHARGRGDTMCELAARLPLYAGRKEDQA